MSKIIKAILLIATLSASMCHSTFLAVPEVEQDIALKSTADVVSFLKGFLEGTSLFYGLEHQDECINTQLPSDVVKRVEDLVAQIKQINIHADIQGIFRQIIEDVLVIYHAIDDTVTGCKSWTGALQAKLEKVKAYFVAEGYLERLTQHALFNIGGLQERIKTGVSAFKSGDFKASGAAFGDVLKFAFYWDL